jgi:hypothetical protein
LPIEKRTFPLLVYSWLQGGLGSHQFTPSEFGEQPAFYFLDVDRSSDHFLEFSGVFWAVERRMGLERVTLRYTRIEAFEEALLSHLEMT